MLDDLLQKMDRVASHADAANRVIAAASKVVQHAPHAHDCTISEHCDICSCGLHELKAAVSQIKANKPTSRSFLKKVAEVG